MYLQCGLRVVEDLRRTLAHPRQGHVRGGECAYVFVYLLEREAFIKLHIIVRVLCVLRKKLNTAKPPEQSKGV